MPFTFNLHSSLLLPPFIQGLLYCVLLFIRWGKEKTHSDALLALLLLMNSLKVAFWMLGYAGWYDSHDGFTTFMFYFNFNTIILIGPLLYFYFLSLTNTDFKFTKEHRKHFIIPIVWILFIVLKCMVDFVFYYPFPNTADFQFGTKGPFAEFDKSWVAYALSYFSFFYYIQKTLKEFKLYKIYINAHFSSTETISFTWLRNLLYAVAACGLIMFLFFMADLLNNGLTYDEDWYSYLILGIIIYYISINGYNTIPSQKLHLHYIHSDQSDQSEEAVEIPKNEAPPAEWDSLKQELQTYMKTQRPYLNPHLTLNELSRAISTNSSYLSRLINEGFDQNFNDFINTYRVKEFALRIHQGEHKKKTILSIAFDCGFNSKTTFNRSFKKVFLKTPVDYINSVNEPVT